MSACSCDCQKHQSRAIVRYGLDCIDDLFTAFFNLVVGAICLPIALGIVAIPLMLVLTLIVKIGASLVGTWEYFAGFFA
jgi:hypothetical protein